MRLVFAGTPAFAVPTLEALHAAGHDIVAVYTQPDRPAGRGRKLAPSAVAERAAALGLRIEKPLKLDTVAQPALRALAPEVMIVVAYGLLLPQAVLDIPQLGCLNVHASLLPRWRGAAPIARAIEAGDTETGVCVMQMEAGLDTGPVLATARWPLAPGTTAADAHDALAALGATLLVNNLPAYAAGALAAQPQASDGAIYARKLSKDEARIDWTCSATELARRVCAFNPAPVAWTLLGEDRIRLWRAAAGATVSNAAPGTIVGVDAEGLHVVCGDGRVLCISELQRPGGRALIAAEAVRGWPVLGQRLV